MRTAPRLTTATAALLWSLMPAIALAADPLATGDAEIDGRTIHYEVHGSGEPLVLLHGGVSPTAETFGPTLEALAHKRRVVGVHLQGHGRTPDVDRPLSYEAMADDVAALIAGLGIGPVDVVGYSLGGGVATQLAIRHPDAVDRLVVLGSAMASDGYFPEVRAAFDHMPDNAAQIAKNIAGSPLGQRYPDVDWETLMRKIGELGQQPRDWSEDFAAMRAPTLLVFADADAIRPEHMTAMYAARGGGQRDAGIDGSQRVASQLAIVPGATHYDLARQPIIPALVLPFLEAE